MKGKATLSVVEVEEVQQTTELGLEAEVFGEEAAAIWQGCLSIEQRT